MIKDFLKKINFAKYFLQIKLVVKNQYFLIFLGVAIVLFLVGVGYYFWQDTLKTYSQIFHLETGIPEERFFRKIDGVEIKPGEEDGFPYAVMIDNHFEAWPTQFGLSQASLVYETIVEGSATRLMAIFVDQEVAKIGPIRSARPYYLNWVSEFNAVYAHCGGSPDALTKIEKYALVDLDQFNGQNSDYFWRSFTEDPPHNLFTKTKLINRASTDYNLIDNVSEYVSWKFKDQSPEIERSENEQIIEIDWAHGRTYDVQYEYDREKNIYLRFIAGGKQIDRSDNSQLFAKNVVVQYVPNEIVLDNIGRIELDVLGEGKALVFQDGKVVISVWEKLDRQARTIFYQADILEEIEFNRGITWIEVVPENRNVLY